MPAPEFNNATIIFVDDEQEILNALRRAMRKTDANCIFIDNPEEALELLASQPADIVVSDIKMPGMNGVDFLSEVSSLYPETVRLVLSGHADFDFVMGAVNSGKVYGYLHKPWKNEDLIASLKQALHTRSLQLERMLLMRSLSKFERFNRHQFHGFIGDSAEMQLVYHTIEMVGPSNASVFITGSSGTGKEIAAQAIHLSSKRADKPFIALNCAAIPNDLVESEIFGHLKGAFTGAVQSREGAAFKANGGTLFLDELAEMDIALQSKLLRFIQTGTFQRVGSDRVEQVDIRFICATNKDPIQAIKNKELREDLFYRLNVVSIDLPDLKDRQWDTIVLAEHFLQHYAEKEKKSLTGFSDDAEKLLIHYHWPGNVRQLQNTINSITILSAGPIVVAGEIARVLKIDDELLEQLLEKPLPYISQSIDKSRPRNSEDGVATNTMQDSTNNRDEEKFDDIHSEIVITDNGSAKESKTSRQAIELKALSDMERDIIEYAIECNNGNVVSAARQLSVSPSTLYRKIQNWQSGTS